MTALVAHKSHPGTFSGYSPADLRVDDPRILTGISEETAATAVAVVTRYAGDDRARVLDMLGLAVTA